MEIQSLKFFRTVAAEGSFSKAAQKLNYAQSNLSTRINQLEKELGVSLFHRYSYGVTLTPRGEQLLQYATALLNIAEETEKAMRDGGIAKGRLTIGSMQSTAMTVLPSMLAKYHAAFPQVSLCVKTGTTETSLRGVLDHRLDGAFVAGPVQHPELVVKEIRREQLVLVAAVGTDLSTDLYAALQQPLLVFPQGCSYRKMLERWLADEGIFAAETIEFDSINAIIASVSAGLGISLFPKNVIDAYAGSGTLQYREIPACYADISTVFIYRKNEYMETSLKKFIQAL